MKLTPLLIALIAFMATACSKDEGEEEYTRMITERVDKIVEPLGIVDDSKAARVHGIIVQQYRDLRKVHDARDIGIKEIKEHTSEGEKVADARIKMIEDKAISRQNELHEKYLSKLSKELTPEQIDQVKDGMTYSAYPITYRNYMAMLPDLTEEQKNKIRAWLIEAREHAMDAGSSKEKLGWFGEYKGRITNYLWAAGYDLKEAEEAWAKRRKAKATVDEIMSRLAIADSARAKRVSEIIADQYKKLRVIHDIRDAQVEAAEEQGGDNKEASDAGIITAWKEAKVKLTALHDQYLSRLSEELTPEQIVKVKDGMTDDGLHKDYSRFTAMLPDLTEEQKDVIMGHLIEAREYAMDAGSPKEIRQWFAKYRGRANNYLSDEGYDLRKATEYLKNKRKAASQANKKEVVND